MQQYQGRPAQRERREGDNRRPYASIETTTGFRERKHGEEPAKFNTRTVQQRISWENDLYERQSM